ncbi:MAG: phospho-sugar mutase [Bacteroidia bacterium]|nr:phospho-sugar mutase [Bacteroidia bacterium]MBT8274839.1 phospho-sugar mutase [Bacteroidia bacterium]NNF31169.1 phospho-sugar mutase [Flavobacteriaceae bacterium]NNK54599.1 phospho-sugar mutase [Flavobacteriaceae bacterium]NNM09545.1 phospho-sugar mutase [Flavobacteriaceae bacterium]
MIYVDPKILDRVNQWLTPVFDIETQHTIKEMIAYDPEGLEDSFYKSLEFGTGGMRGVMGVGDNRINKYTLGKNTQGLSNYLYKQFPNEQLKVAIAYDCRHNSKELAKVVADVFSANDIEVFLYSDLRPTPELSFSVRHLECHCGIVLTASHNPPEYNGYKVYWQDGGQLVPPQDGEIIAEINGLQYAHIKFDGKADLIHYIDQDIDKAFAAASLENGSFSTPQAAKDKLKIVFTSLHGTSITMIPQVLDKAGYKNLHIVEAQAKPDGDFPTVESPNPEEPEALKMAMELAEEEDADIVIGTDPDCDRLGIAVRDEMGKLVILNGNQAMVVMCHFLLEQWKKTGKLNGNQFLASTIVSTPMVKVITESFGVKYKEGLTGFKWIAKMVKDFPELEFIGGGEESFGFMVGDFVRDKDAVTATLLACEIAALKKQQGSSIYGYLQELYKEYGYYLEQLVSMVKKGKKGAEEIIAMMRSLRENPMKEIAGSKVVRIEDYESGKATDILNGKVTEMDIPRSNVLIYFTEDGSKIAARPSGTEPKIKFYMSVHGSGNNESIMAELHQKIERIKTELQL